MDKFDRKRPKVNITAQGAEETISRFLTKKRTSAKRLLPRRVRKLLLFAVSRCKMSGIVGG